MAATLADAVRLVIEPAGHPRTARARYEAWAERRDAAKWFLTDGTAHPFSFESICDVLDLDMAALRGRLDAECNLRALLRREEGSADEPASTNGRRGAR